MHTDVPCKRVTHLCPGDLIALFGVPGSIPLAVETLELPVSPARLDTVVRLRHPAGYEYLHLLEWQGYHDPRFLWRVLSYVGWLGQNRTERPILVTLIYLKPGDEPAELLGQQVDGMGGWAVDFSTVRLWQLDARAAIASRAPGLVTLSPLMHGADAELVEEAARLLLETTTPPVQGELLTVLGIFAEPLIEAQRLLNLLNKEDLMTNSFIATLFQTELASITTEREQLKQAKDTLEQEKDTLEQAKDALEQAKDALEHEKDALEQTLHHSIGKALLLRFPAAPAALIAQIARISNAAHLQRLFDTILSESDLADVEAVVAENIVMEQP